MADYQQGDFDIPEQISPILEMAIIMHETYMAFRKAGFSEPQAMQFVSTMLVKNEEGLDD